MSAPDSRGAGPEDGRGTRIGPFGLEEALDGELCAETVARLEKHLEGCTECAEEMARLRALKALLRRTMPVSAPPGLRERISVRTRSVTVSDSTGSTTVTRSTLRRLP